MAIAYRDSATGTSATTTPSLTIPGTVATGDAMLLFVTSIDNWTHTTPSGWTLVSSGSGTGAVPIKQSAYWRVAQAGDSGSNLVCTLSGSDWNTLALVAYSGTDSTTPIHVSGRTDGNTEVHTLTAPSVTTSVTNTMIVWCWGGRTNNSVPLTWSPPVTNRTIINSANIKPGSATSDQTQAATGATGVSSCPVSNSGGWADWVGHTIALAPGGPTPITGTETGSGAEGIPVIGQVSRDDH